jgi:hypothetical protein
MQRVLADADVLQLVAAGLSREEAGRLLVFCKAGAQLVRAADAREDAGLQAGWRWGAWPLWEVQRVRERVRGLHYATDLGLARVLESLVTALDELHFTTSPDAAIEYVFERKLACAGVAPSVLGVHRLRVRDNTELVWFMRAWVCKVRHYEYAAATVRRLGRGGSTQLVLNLLKVLGLVPARGRGQQAPKDDRVHAVHSKHQDPLWHKEFVAVSVSKRGWV